MNIKNLSLAIVVLAALAGLAAFLNRPTPPPETDPRVGAPLLATTTANAAQSIQITQGTASVTLTRDGTSEAWLVSSYHDLPVNLTKLRTFVRELTDAKIERVVTRNPELAARLELDSAKIAITSTDGSTWSASLGKTAERGGRYVRLDEGEDAPAFLAPFNAFLDATGKNWAENKLVNVERDQIAALTLTFADGAPITLQRESATAPWTTESLPDGQQLKTGAISTLISTATNLRFSDTTTPDDTDAVDAAAHARTLTVTTFAGDTLTVSIGRRPEKSVVNPPAPSDAATGDQPESAAEAVEDLTETIPAGPTFATVTGPAALAPLAHANAKVAFKISDYTFTSLPQNPAGFFEEAPIQSTSVIESPAP